MLTNVICGLLLRLMNGNNGVRKALLEILDKVKSETATHLRAVSLSVQQMSLVVRPLREKRRAGSQAAERMAHTAKFD